MVIETKVGFYEVLKNVNEALDIKIFEEKYLTEYFDKFTFIVGDLIASSLRIKGFSKDASKKNSFKDIPAYLCESCAFRCAYYVLRRINEEEYAQLKEYYEKNPNLEISKGEEKEFTLEKKPFDKENINLESNKGEKPNIKIDISKINVVKKYELPSWLKEEPKNNKRGNYNGSNSKRNKKDN